MIRNRGHGGPRRLRFGPSAGAWSDWSGRSYPASDKDEITL